MKKIKCLMAAAFLCTMLFALGIVGKAASTVSLSTNGTWAAQTITDDSEVYQWAFVVTNTGKVDFTFQVCRDDTWFKVMDEDKTNTYYSKGLYDGTEDSPVTKTATVWLQKGTYYVTASDCLYGYAGDGLVRVKAEFTSANTTESEPNDTFAQAETLSQGKTVVGALTDIDDRTDFYKIEVPADDGTVTLDLTSFFNASRMDLYDSSQVSVTSGSVSGASESPGNKTWDLTLDAGVYYIKITDNIANADPSGIYYLKWTWTAPIVDVTSVTLGKSSLELTAGDTYTVSASVLPTDATDPSLAWTSSDTGVATVDGNGKITAVGKGTATITATTQDGTELSSACSVTVKAAPAKVTGLSVLTSSTTRTTMTLSWNSVAEASGYRVYIYDTAAKKYVKYKNTTKTTLKIRKLSAETKYKFKVAAYTKSTDGATRLGTKSAACSAYTAPKKLAATKITSKKTTSKSSDTCYFVLKWKKVAGATGYKVYYKTSSGAWKQYGSDTKARSMKMSAAKGTTLKIRVVAYRTKHGITTVGKYSSTVTYKAK
ncbi:MAG: Ig-like domain-containing protein [Clostridiales bacterium]|nr:Ig-like domain-containing protein [Clostridiales bacterium]